MCFCPVISNVPFASWNSSGSFVWVNCSSVICIRLVMCLQLHIVFNKKNMQIPMCKSARVCTRVCVIVAFSSLCVWCVIWQGLVIMAEGEGWAEVRACVELMLISNNQSICIWPYAAAVERPDISLCLCVICQERLFKNTKYRRSWCRAGVSLSDRGGPLWPQAEQLG